MDDSNISHQWTMNSFNQVIPSHQIVAASGESSQPSLSQESFSSCPNSFYATRNDVSSSNSILTHSPNSLFGWSNTFGRPSTQPKEEVEFVISYNNSEQNYEAIGSKQRSNMVKFGAASPQAQDHIVAERKRREKLNQRFIELSAAIPGLKKVEICICCLIVLFLFVQYMIALRLIGSQKYYFYYISNRCMLL